MFGRKCALFVFENIPPLSTLIQAGAYQYALLASVGIPLAAFVAWYPSTVSALPVMLIPHVPDALVPVVDGAPIVL